MEYIYKITNNINGKFYIGKTKDVKNRWKTHLSLVGKKRHPLYDAILHYGKDNFTVDVIDNGDEFIIDQLEIEWIEKTNAINEGYNMTIGGTGGDTFTNKSDELKEITRVRLSEKSKISNAKNIETHRENTKKLWEDDEYRKKVIDGVRRNAESNEYRKRVGDSVREMLKNPEMRKKWSDCKKGNKNGRSLGSVIVTDLLGNKYEYETAKDASDKMKVTAQLIRNHCINGTTFVRGVHKGWKFKYSSDGNI
jgi:group I intron endonuclease